MKNRPASQSLFGKAFLTSRARQWVAPARFIRRLLFWGALSTSLALAPQDLLAASPLPLKNPGMEEGDSVPATWVKGPPVAGVEQTWDRTTAHGGKASLCLKKTALRYFPIAQWSQSMTVEPASIARKLRVRCWVKAQSVTKAIVDVTYQTTQWGHAWAVYLGRKQESDPVATHDWKLYEATVEVPAQASKVGIAFQIYGPGTVWFDDLEVAWAD